MKRIRIFLEKIKEILQNIFKKIIYTAQNNKKKFIAIVLVLLAVVGLGLWFGLRTYHHYEVIQSFDREDGTSAKYELFGGGMICYSKDGVSFTNKDGTTVWNQVFGMELPKFRKSNTYMAIGDMGANSIYIFNQSGCKGKLALEKPLQDFCISEQGVVAAALSDSSANLINLYSMDGNLLVSIKASIQSEGYPLAMALSPDATHFVVSYITFNAGNVGTKLVFYDFSDIELNEKAVDEKTYDYLIPRLQYVGDDLIVACGEKGFASFEFRSRVSEKAFVEYENEIKSVFITNKKIGIVSKNQSEAENAKKYVLDIYGFSGRRSKSFTFDFEYKTLSASDEDIVFNNDQQCQIYTYMGHKKFDYNFDHAIESVLSTDKKGEYVLLDYQSMQLFRLK